MHTYMQIELRANILCVIPLAKESARFSLDRTHKKKRNKLNRIHITSFFFSFFFCNVYVTVSPIPWFSCLYINRKKSLPAIAYHTQAQSPKYHLLRHFQWLNTLLSSRKENRYEIFDRFIKNLVMVFTSPSTKYGCGWENFSKPSRRNKKIAP